MQAFLTLLIEVFVVSFIAISVVDIVIAALPEPKNTVVAPHEWAVAFEPVEAEPHIATIDWVQPVVEEPIVSIDVIAIAKSHIISTAKRYKLRGEEVIHLTDIPFPLPQVKTYQLRSQPVVKLSHLLAAMFSEVPPTLLSVR